MHIRNTRKENKVDSDMKQKIHQDKLDEASPESLKSFSLEV